MVERQRRRSRDISLTIHTFSLTAAPSGSYGLKLTGKAPAMVAKVQSGSAAGKAGLIVGDFVLKVSAKETRTYEAEQVLQLLKERVGGAVEVVVARPYPVPVTDKEKMRALIVLQTKLDSGTIFQPAAPTYSTAVQDALAATQDILGDLGLDLNTNQTVPNSMGGGHVQEVELQMYDSDALPSPPPSSESEGEKDPLLDFTREDDLTYHSGQGTYHSGQGAQSMADSVRQATKALENIQTLTAGLQKKEKQPRKSAGLVSSEASFMPSRPRNIRRSKSPPGVDKGWSKSPPGVDKGRSKSPPGMDKGRSKSPPGVDKGRSVSPSVLDVPAEELQWREAAVTAVEQHSPTPPVPPHTTQSSTNDRDIPPPVPPHGRRRDGSLSKGDEGERVLGGVVARRHAPRAPVRGQAEHVIMRKKPNKDLPAGMEDDGKVMGVPASYRPLHPPPTHHAPSPPSQDPVTDMADQETALRGLPPSILSWQGQEVATWLLQLSPSLSQHYRPCFTRHDITGQSLMRLNLSKLKSMGIDNIKHCRQLALEIAKLKIYQESLELRELEEENQISFL